MNFVKGKTYRLSKFCFREFSPITKTQYTLPHEVFNVVSWLRQSSLEIIDKAREPAQQSKPYMIYIVWQQAEFTKTLHQLVSRAGFMVEERQRYLDITQRVLTGIQRFASVGNSSTFADTYISDDLTQRPLFLLSSKHILVDFDTRKPVRFADLFRKTVNSDNFDLPVPRREFPDLCKTLYEIPQDAKTYVRSSCMAVHQLDYNNHTNQAAYIELCFDCIGEAVPTGFCHNMTDSIWKYPVRRSSLLFLKESNLGDKVETVVWQDSKNPWIFHFHVMKNSQVICQSQLEFYDPTDLGLDSTSTV